MCPTIKDKLRLLDFETGSTVSGLVFTDGDYADISFDEILVLHHARQLKANAVFFRRMEGRCSIPQIFIYDNSDGRLSGDDLIDIHRKLSSSGIVPLYYIFDDVEVKIYDCRKPLRLVGKELKAESFDSLHLVATAHDKFKRYSAQLFRNGSFWELEENRERFKANTSSHKKLIDNLKKLRDVFAEGQKNVTACNKLIVLSILVKYLEERKDSKGNHALPKGYFSKFNKAQSFCDVLRKENAIELFEDLGTTINGSIFRLDKNESIEIGKLNQAKLADFLDANIELDRQQYVLWPLYDFNYLPVEMISRIYEEFIPDRKDIAYTPPCLVNFMIDECMPIDKPQKNYKVIDVSCGSGIFLVGAFKRIIQWWQYNQFQETREIKPPKLRSLKPLLRDSIFGVDIEHEAVRLAIFSLTIAVCDMLDPMTMWKELNEEKLEDLSANIAENDFFDFLSTNNTQYNLVIGNPPFNPPFKEEEKEKKAQYWNDLMGKIGLDFEIPDRNIALLFLQQSMKLLKDDGLLSLVMPSGPLLYNNTLDYRRSFLKKYNVPQIFDFSRLNLFKTNYPVSVLFAEKRTPDNKDILHIVVQRTKTSKDKLFFEIDKYDVHYIAIEIAQTEQLIWKANYLGGGHLVNLLKRTSNMQNLETFIEKKNNWVIGEGYKLKGKSTKVPEKADWLTGKNRVITEKFCGDKIDKDGTEIEKALYFERTCKTIKQIFQPPHLLIKETPDLPVVLSEEDLIFRNEIIGIYAPAKNELIQLRNNIIANKKLYKMLLLSGSGRAGVSRSVYSILKSNFMQLPYPDDPRKLKLSKAEEIICDDILDYYIDQMAKGEDAKINIIEAGKKDLALFGKTFCASLNSIYKDKAKAFYSIEPILSPSYICMPFIYGNSDKPDEISKKEREQIKKGDLSSMMDNTERMSVHYKRIIKKYRQDKHMLYLIKPRFLRYWLRSIALRDANEVFTDLVSSGY